MHEVKYGYTAKCEGYILILIFRVLLDRVQSSDLDNQWLINYKFSVLFLKNVTSEVL